MADAVVMEECQERLDNEQQIDSKHCLDSHQLKAWLAEQFYWWANSDYDQLSEAKKKRQ